MSDIGYGVCVKRLILEFPVIKIYDQQTGKRQKKQEYFMALSKAVA